VLASSGMDRAVGPFLSRPYLPVSPSYGVGLKGAFYT